MVVIAAWREMSNELTKLCFEITKRAIDSNVADDNTPPSIGRLYLFDYFSNTSIISKNEVSNACNVSEVTIY